MTTAKIFATLAQTIHHIACITKQTSKYQALDFIRQRRNDRLLMIFQNTYQPS